MPRARGILLNNSILPRGQVLFVPESAKKQISILETLRRTRNASLNVGLGVQETADDVCLLRRSAAPALRGARRERVGWRQTNARFGRFWGGATREGMQLS